MSTQFSERIANAGCRPLLALRYWIVALVVAGSGLFALERFFASGVVWRLPLSLLLNDSRDRNTRSAWLINQPPNGRPQIVLFGASNAFAAMELPGEGTTRLFRETLNRSDIEFMSLAAGGTCYDEYLLLLENVLRQGHKIELVIAFTQPGCLTKQEGRPDASRAVTMPLVSTWLLETQREFAGLSSDDEWWARWSVQHLALARYRRPVNSWMRRRFTRAINGNSFWHIRLGYDRYVKPWAGPFERDIERYREVRAWPQRMEWNGAGRAYLTSFLAHAKTSGVPILLTEVPWSPPMRELLKPIRHQYEQVVRQLASSNSAEYWDLNDELHLGSQYFADTYHVTPAGRALYLKATIAKSVQALRSTQARQPSGGHPSGRLLLSSVPVIAAASP